MDQSTTQEGKDIKSTLKGPLKSIDQDPFLRNSRPGDVEDLVVVIKVTWTESSLYVVILIILTWKVFLRNF